MVKCSAAVAAAAATPLVYPLMSSVVAIHVVKRTYEYLTCKSENRN